MDLLEKEGLARRSVLVGDVMYDSVLHSVKLAEQKYGDREIVPYEKYYLATVHRQENTDQEDRLKKILTAFSKMDLPVVLPLHPRTKNFINKANLNSNIKIIEPVGYLEMLMLIHRSEKVLTDSGGLQKEAFFLEKQCVTLRDETEWTETLVNNWNILSGVEPDKILQSLDTDTTGSRGNYFGDGQAGKKILTSMIHT